MKKLLLASVLAWTSCDKVGGAVEEVCGACPDVAEGELLVTGSAQIDGFFKALNVFQNASARINGDFEAHVTAIGDAFGVVRAEGMSVADYATAVKTEVSAQINANVEGSLEIDYVPPQCQANLNVMVEAQAECQVDAGCTPGKITPGEVSVQCEGQCQGSCDAMCSGSCVVEVTGGKCTGSCEGACNLEAAASCSGTCNGSCDGTCEVKDSSGNCKGKCTGNCTGTCEMAVAAECSGTCTGKCVPPSAEAMCEGECRGSCMGSCTGSCTGSATPPMVDLPDCDVEAECNASASAQASASLECSPPRLDIDYNLQASLDAEAKAAFLAKFAVFKTEIVGIVQGFANARILVEGDAELDIPPIQDVIAGQIEVAASADVEAYGNITPYGALCAIGSLGEAAGQVKASASGLVATVAAQAEFVGMLGI